MFCWSITLDEFEKQLVHTLSVEQVWQTVGHSLIDNLST